MQFVDSVLKLTDKTSSVSLFMVNAISLGAESKVSAAGINVKILRWSFYWWLWKEQTDSC